MSILQFPEHFQLIFDKIKCQQRQTELSNFSSLSFWGKPLWKQKLLLLTVTARRSCYTLVTPFPMLSCFPFFHKFFLEAILEAKVAPTNRNSLAFLLHTSSNVAFNFFINFFGTDFCHQNVNNVVDAINWFVYQLSKKILRILCVWTLKILYTNKRILT